MSRVSTGAVSVGEGGTVVTAWAGDGGVILSEITSPAGSAVVIEGVANFIKTRLSTTSVELVLPHAGAGGDDLACAISALTAAETQISTLNARTASFVQQLSVLDANGRGLFYNLIGVTGDNDPGPGNMAFNNAAVASVTKLFVDVLDANTGGRDVSGLLNLWTAGTVLTVRSLATNAYATYRLSGPPVGTTYRSVTVIYVGHDGALAAEPVAIEWRLAGADKDVDEEVADMAGRAAYNGAAARFRVLVRDAGDGRAARFTKNSGTSADWSGAAYFTGPASTVPGPPAVVWRGTYGAGTAYVVNDGVLYNGSSWRAKIATTGNAPPALPATSNTQWELVARAGTDGTGTGDVVGPGAAVDGKLPMFSGTTGKVLSDSGFGVRNAIPFPAATNAVVDCDTIVTSGWFNGLVRGGPSYAAHSPPSPDGAYWFIEVLTYGSGTALAQIAWPYGPSKYANSSMVPMWRGTNSSGVWSAWVPLVSPADVSLSQTQVFYGTLALEQAEDRSSGPVLSGTDGNGVFDGFNVLTYVDVAGATSLDTGAAGQLKPAAGSVTTVGNTATPAAGSVNFGGITLADRSYSLTNSRTVTEIKLYSSTALATTLKIVKRNSSTNYDVVYSQAFAHPGGGWATMTLTTPQAIPGSGTYHIALYYAASQTIETFSASAARASFGSGNAAGTGQTVTETTGSVFATNVTLTTGIGSLSVASSGFSVSAAPDWARLLAFVTLNGAVLGTDILFDISRNGGANWQAVTMTQLYLRADGSAVLDSGIVALTATSGTTVKWRIRTANGKSPAVRAVGLMVGVN